MGRLPGIGPGVRIRKPGVTLYAPRRPYQIAVVSTGLRFPSRVSLVLSFRVEITHTRLPNGQARLRNRNAEVIEP